MCDTAACTVQPSTLRRRGWFAHRDDRLARVTPRVPVSTQCSGHVVLVVQKFVDSMLIPNDRTLR